MVLCYAYFPVSFLFFFFFQIYKILWELVNTGRDFPGGSVDKESACNAGDLGSIPCLERFPG